MSEEEKRLQGLVDLYARGMAEAEAQRDELRVRVALLEGEAAAARRETTRVLQVVCDAIAMPGEPRNRVALLAVAGAARALHAHDGTSPSALLYDALGEALAALDGVVLR